MPMRLSNAPTTFQYLMSSIFGEYTHIFMVVYMDEILIYCHSEENHLERLTTVLQSLSEYELYAGA